MTPLTLTFRLAIPKPVYLLTVQKARKEYNSLTDQIQAKYEQLDYNNNNNIYLYSLIQYSCCFEPNASFIDSQRVQDTSKSVRLSTLVVMYPLIYQETNTNMFK